jgi:hypothetical protein
MAMEPVPFASHEKTTPNTHQALRSEAGAEGHGLKMYEPRGFSRMTGTWPGKLSMR